MLTVLPVLSQEDTVKLPYSIAKKAAIDLEELDRLKLMESINQLKLANYLNQLEIITQQSRNKSLQIEMLNHSLQLYKTQYAAEKARKPKSNWVTWTLAVIAAFGGGIVVGLVN